MMSRRTARRPSRSITAIATLGLLLAPLAAADGEVIPPGTVQIQLSDATGPQFGIARIEATLATNGVQVVETSNTITLPAAVVLSAGSCSGNTNIGKSMLVSLVALTESSTTIRVQLQPFENTDPIPDGFLYRCGVIITPTTRVGTYRASVGDVRALDPDGAALPASGSDGHVIVVAGDVTPGDLNADGAIDVDDLARLVTLLHRDDVGGAADVNGDVAISAADLVALVQQIALTAPAT